MNTQHIKELSDRITQYLVSGGLFNPESMDHDAVKELLIECRWALDEADRNIYPDEDAGMYINKQLKAYTELVVKECAATIQDLVDHRVPASEYSRRLKEQFGVE
jgi:hypothetical protein